jgi:glutamate decarboxylase
VFAFALKHASRYSVFDLSGKLREHGWQAPAYTVPAKLQDLAVLRVVVREGFSRDTADMLLNDLKKAVAFFESVQGHKAKKPAPHFAHL